MSPKQPGAPKKPRWTQAKKAAARRTDGTPRPARKHPRRPDAPARDDRWGSRDRREDTRGDDRRPGGFRGRDDRSFSRDRREDTRGGDRRTGGFRGRDDRFQPSDDRRRGDRPYAPRSEDDRRGGRRFDRDDNRFEDRRGSRGGYGDRPRRDRHEDVDGGWAAGRGRAERHDDRRYGNRDDRRPDSARPDRPDRQDRRPSGNRFERRDDRFGGRDDRRGDTRRDDRYGRRDDTRRDDRYGRRDDTRRDDRYGRRDDTRRDDRYGRRDETRRDERYGRRDETRREDRYPRRDDARREDRYPRREDTRRDDARRDGDSRGTEAPRREPHRAPADAPAARAEQLHRKEAPAVAPVDLETNGFAALGVPEALVKRLARDGITTPFPIQEATIPDALAGRDVLGRGRTGSGKTLAFGLPMLARLAQGERAKPNRPTAIVLSPTRELAMQISDALQPLVHVLGLRHKLVAGGMPYPPQFDALDRGVDVLVATPGRLADLIERGACTLEGCEIVVLDEADHMADMGFLPEVTELMDQVPAGGQRLLFSATLDKGIDTLVESYLQDPVTHSTDEAQASVTTMAHHILLVEPVHKKVVTAHVANRGGHTIVFVRTKLGADRVAMQLREEGVFAAALHGGLSQSSRNRVLSAFRDGTIPVLVATDVAARGIHVDDVGVVLQVDPPTDHKDYLHRAGRTARAGEQGTVVTLALPHQKRQMQRIADQAGLDITPEKVAPGDDRLHEMTGANRPVGDPIPEERLRRLLEPPQRPRRGGYRQGGRGGGRGDGGFARRRPRD